MEEKKMFVQPSKKMSKARMHRLKKRVQNKVCKLPLTKTYALYFFHKVQYI